MRVSRGNDAPGLLELSAEELELLQKRAQRYALAASEEDANVHEAVVFRRGEGRFAIPLAALREVRPMRGFCPIPLASNSVPGIVHFRGEILGLHDAFAFMSGAPFGGAPSWLIVVEHAGERLGLGADEIIDIERYGAGRIAPLPLTLGDRGAICDGVLSGDVFLLSPPRLFRTDGFFSAF